MMDLLHVSGIGLQEGENTILQDISFSQPEFHKLAIAGETGSGKSTLLQIIAGLVQPDTGRVLFDQKQVVGPQDQLIPGHPDIAYLSQQFELPQFLRVEQVLQYANKLEEDDAENLFEMCHIRHLLKRRTSELSGGERQRIALARLLLGSPRLLLLDEPYSNLDMAHKKLLKSVIQNIGEELEISLLLVSHDPLDTLSWADEIIVLKDGKIQQKATPAQVYQQPVNEYTAGLFGNYNIIPAGSFGIFPELAAGKPKRKKLFIRPERFSFSAQPDAGVPGIVKGIAFYGSYYEVQVQLSALSIAVRTYGRHFNIGDMVSVVISPSDISETF